MTGKQTGQTQRNRGNRGNRGMEPENRNGNRNGKRKRNRKGKKRSEMMRMERRVGYGTKSTGWTMIIKAKGQC